MLTRRRPSAARVVAVCGPLASITLVSVSFVLGGAWPRLAALVCAGGCLGLGILVGWLDRRRHVDVAAARSRQAAAYDRLHAQHTSEHIEFTGYMVGLIDSAEEAMSALRSRLDGVEGALDETRRAVARSESAAVRAEQARAAAEQRANAAERAAVEAEQIALDAETLLQELATELDRDAGPVSPQQVETGPTVPTDEPLVTRRAATAAEMWTVTDAPTVVDLAARDAIDAAVAQADRRTA